MLSAGTDSYLRFPTLRGDLVGFVAQEDVWLAQWKVAGGLAEPADAPGSPLPR
jgi:tricorn protease-like protein